MLINKIIITLLLILITNSCIAPPSTSCITPNTQLLNIFSTQITTSYDFKVQANANYSNQLDDSSYGKWLNTGITVKNGANINIKTSGTVFICPSAGLNSDNGLQITVDAKNPNWNFISNSNSLIYVHKGDIISINTTAPTLNCPAGNLTPSCNRWARVGDPKNWDTNNLSNNDLCNNQADDYSKVDNIRCWHINGFGLIGYLGSNTQINASGGTKFLMTKESPYLNTQYVASDSGYLGFGLFDTNNDYNDNIGGYTFNVRHYACPAYNGNSAAADPNGGALQAIIASNDVNLSGTNKSQFFNNVNGNNLVTQEGTIWLRISDSDLTANYLDNIGFYNIRLDISQDVGVFSTLLTKLTTIINNTMSEAAKSIFNNLTCGENNSGNCLNYVKLIRALLTLYIILYAVCYLFGLVQINQLDLVIRLIKIAIIIALISPQAWEFFNTHLFNLFINGSGYLAAIVTGGVMNSDGSYNPFTFADPIIQYVIFDPSTILRLLGLILATNLGIIYFLLILYGTITMMLAIFKAVLTYLISYIVIALLIALAPVFIPFILFQNTRNLFDNWLKYLARYSLEPAMLITGLAFLSQIILNLMNKFMSHTVCWKCALPLKISIPGLTSMTLFCIDFYLPWGYDNSEAATLPKIFGSFADIILFIIIARLMSKYSELSSDIVARITNSLNARSISDDRGVVSSMQESIKSMFGLDQNSQARRRTSSQQIDKSKEVRAQQQRTQRSDTLSNNDQLVSNNSSKQDLKDVLTDKKENSVPSNLNNNHLNTSKQFVKPNDNANQSTSDLLKDNQANNLKLNESNNKQEVDSQNNLAKDFKDNKDIADQPKDKPDDQENSKTDKATVSKREDLANLNNDNKDIADQSKDKPDDQENSKTNKATVSKRDNLANNLEDK